MKTKRKSKKQLPEENEKRKPTVTLEYFDSKARQVNIAGTFNDWHPSATEMISLGNGRWAKELTLAPGIYEYRFVVDGVWVDDPSNPCRNPNSFGSFNNVLRVIEG